MTSRRTDWKEVIKAVKEELKSFSAEGYKPTLRTMFYRLFSKQLIPNTSSAYDSLGKNIVKARWSYLEQSYLDDSTNTPLPPDCIVDNSREVICNFNEAYLTPQQLIDGRIQRLKNSEFDYENLIPRWHNQPEYVEVWIEKDAMAPTLQSILQGLDVRIVPNKGFSGMTFLYENVQRLLNVILDEHKHVHILYYGDFDPSGDYMDTDLNNRLERFGLDFEKYLLNTLFNIEMIINDINYIFIMTMGCPLCGAMMVWLNGSISHDPPVKQYECRNCNIRLIKQPDGSYEIVQLKDH